MSIYETYKSSEVVWIGDIPQQWKIKRLKRILKQEDIDLISSTYHKWRNPNGSYEDIAGFCKSATMEEVIQGSYEN